MASVSNRKGQFIANAEDLSILIVDDEEVVHDSLSAFMQRLGHRVEHAFDGEEALKKLEETPFDLALVDVRMPRLGGFELLEKIWEVRPHTECVIITGHAKMETAIQALRMGAADFLPKPIRLMELEAVLEKSARIRNLLKERRRLRATIQGLQVGDVLQTPRRQFVGVSDATKQVRREIQQAVDAQCDTMLITGDTGTGKEVAAREIHFSSGDGEQPFISVSCPALTDTLIESALFGHVSGSFTGATTDRSGYFELAHNGTLFLDEVADLSANAQAVLLRVLETRSFRKVGDSREISVNVRVIAATNIILEEAIEKGHFRRDLFYRLNLFRIKLSPLSERKDDILPLAEHFLNGFSAPRGWTFNGFSDDAKRLLNGYSFPGNARELKNIVERAAILCHGSGNNGIQAGHLAIEDTIRVETSLPSAGNETHKTPPNSEEEAILKALEAAKWNRRKAAEILDLSYATLRYRMTKLGLDRN